MWNLRIVVERVVEQGRRALHLVRRPATHHHHPRQQQQVLPHKLSKCVREGAGEAAAVGCVAGQAGSVASRLRPFTTQLIQSIFRRVPAPLWTEARRRTTQRLVFGASAPYFALVGVTLVGGSQGLVTRDDELEALCGTVREAIGRAGWIHNPEFWKSHQEESQHQDEKQQPREHEEQKHNKSTNEDHVFSLKDFTLGPVIDKGCNAVVYSARWNLEDKNDHERQTPLENEEQNATIREAVQGLPLPLEPIQECDGSTLENSSVSSIFQPLEDQAETTEANITDHKRLLEKCELRGAVTRIPLSSSTSIKGENIKENETSGEEQHDFPLAIKMMFNYEAESNAPAILRVMYKEILPARNIQLDEAQQEWEERLCGPRVSLSSHPNIVDMPCVFVDQIPLLEGCLDLYPQALPARLNPQGYGRNMSLFCVMKRYDISLRDYLSQYHPSQHTCLLLLTQLLEALLHLKSNNIAHRDLKSDNILLSLAEGWQYPHLIVSDFGCSLVGDNSSLSVSFPSREADPRQGNPALMAPEVKTATPGLLSSVPYGQSDLWASGTLIYEIYGLENPFSPAATLPKRKSKPLDSATYKESQLPRLPRSVPSWVKNLTNDILRRNPRSRPTVNIAATLCQLMLWAPSKWLNRHSLTLPTHTEVTQWLLCLAAKVLCEARLPNGNNSAHQHTKTLELDGNADHQGSQLEYQMVSTFLARVHYVDIIQAIKWNRAF